MTDVRTAVDGSQILALQSEFTDAGMMRDYDIIAGQLTWQAY
ncbi:MAG TPA: hypothetical protein VN520_34545 [Streptomyces sp.]|nr:hypothetical protein [Streptomyces sp.]HWU11421.1 hypothetical protein [Streptomyces sp.]